MRPKLCLLFRLPSVSTRWTIMTSDWRRKLRRFHLVLSNLCWIFHPVAGFLTETSLWLEDAALEKESNVSTACWPHRGFAGTHKTRVIMGNPSLHFTLGVCPLLDFIESIHTHTGCQDTHSIPPGRQTCCVCVCVCVSPWLPHTPRQCC